MTLARILRRSVRKSNGCILFRPGKNLGARYGSVFVNGHRYGAHKAVWILTKGPVPEGLCVCHRCDQPRCVNINHLFLGTMAENMADRDAKGRNGTLGENSPLAKLTAPKVLEIRRLADLGFDRSFIAGMHSISLLTVNRIAKGTTWKHLLKSPTPSPSPEALAVA